MVLDLTDSYEHVALQYEVLGTHSLRAHEEDEVTWTVGHSGAGTDPLDAWCSAPAPAPETLRAFRLAKRGDGRPARPCDFPATGNPLAPRALEFDPLNPVSSRAQGPRVRPLETR